MRKQESKVLRNACLLQYKNKNDIKLLNISDR